eukprot:12895052-Prorocentrum_lima.AAC.1
MNPVVDNPDLVDKGILRPGGVRKSDFKHVGKRLVGQLRYARNPKMLLNDSGWMFVCDAK